MNGVDAVKAVRRLIVDYMGLPEDRVWVSGEREQIPKDQDIFVTLTPGQSTVMSNTQRYVDEELVIHTVLSMTIAVEVASRGASAIERHPEVLQALITDTAQRLMEKDQFSIFRPANTQDLSDITGTGTLRRYRIPVIVHYLQGNEIVPDIYDRFREEQTLY